MVRPTHDPSSDDDALGTTTIRRPFLKHLYINNMEIFKAIYSHIIPFVDMNNIVPFSIKSLPEAQVLFILKILLINTHRLSLVSNSV